MSTKRRIRIRGLRRDRPDVSRLSRAVIEAARAAAEAKAQAQSVGDDPTAGEESAE